MRQIYSFLILLATGCGPENGATNASTGTPSTGEEPTTTAPTTGEPATSSTGEPATSSTDGTTSTATTDDVTTGDATTIDLTTGDACLEHEIDDPGDWPEELVLGCQLPELCPGEEPLDLETPEKDVWTTDDIDRARCMAAAMRDRTPGKLLYQETIFGETRDFFVIEIHGEQVSLRHTHEGLGFGYDYNERVTFLREADFFTACAEGDASEVHNCLATGFTDECATQLECPR